MNCKNKGITVIEMFWLVLFIVPGVFMASYLGTKIGYLGIIIGFPLGIALVIGVFYVLNKPSK